jgi:hypothetical protein
METARIVRTALLAAIVAGAVWFAWSLFENSRALAHSVRSPLGAAAELR